MVFLWVGTTSMDRELAVGRELTWAVRTPRETGFVGRSTLRSAVAYAGYRGSPLINPSGTCNMVKKLDGVVSPTEPSRALASPSNTSERTVRWQQRTGCLTLSETAHQCCTSPAVDRAWCSTSVLRILAPSFRQPTISNLWRRVVAPNVTALPQIRGCAKSWQQIHSPRPPGARSLALGAIVRGRRETMGNTGQGPWSQSHRKPRRSPSIKTSFILEPVGLFRLCGTRHWMA